jgi:hypothetical protein
LFVELQAGSAKRRFAQQADVNQECKNAQSNEYI